jgi:FG-GAP repeat
LPLAARQEISQALGGEDRSYQITPPTVTSSVALRSSAVSLRGRNRAQGFSLGFAALGVQVAASSGRLGLGLRAIGYGQALGSLSAVAPTADANRVVYARPGVSEWYVNGPVGLEQGFSISRAPVGSRTGPLTLSLALSDDMQGVLARDHQSVAFSGRGGPMLRYGSLSARDANGRTLGAWLALEGDRLLIEVAAQHARYPLRIDPLIQQGSKITGGSEESGAGGFGDSVALSPSGTTALIGAAEDNKAAGASWVFTRNEKGERAQQGKKLTGKEETGEGDFGSGVALFSDGNTALIGGWDDNSRVGAAWVFTRSEGKWTQQGGKLTGKEEISEGIIGGLFGYSVALSSNGNTALVGGPGDNKSVGAAWVFTRSEGKWTQQGGKLTGKEVEGEGEFGFSVALSSNGNTALIGSPRDKKDAGAARVFV